MEVHTIMFVERLRSVTLPTLLALQEFWITKIFSFALKISYTAEMIKRSWTEKYLNSSHL